MSRGCARGISLLEDPLIKFENQRTDPLALRVDLTPGRNVRLASNRAGEHLL